MIHSFQFRNLCKACSKTACWRRGMAQIVISPPVALMDEPVEIRVDDLKPKQRVTLAARLQEEDDVFVSHGHYVADEAGVVDLTSLKSQGGSYTGLEPMGLFWGLHPEEGSKDGLRLRKRDVTSPHHVSVSVLEGHVDARHSGVHEESVLVKGAAERHYCGPGVVRVPVHHGRLRGTLFIPNNRLGRHAGVIDLYGSTGGLPEYRAALLASRGITAFALAYLAYQDLPKGLHGLPIEYFEEAIEYLSSHENVQPGGVGLIGISLGAILALKLATISKQIRAVVTIGACDSFCMTILNHKGKDIPYTTMDPSLFEFTDQGLDCREGLYRATCDWADATIPVEQASHTDFCFIHGTHEATSDPRFISKIASRLLDHGHRNFSIHMYQGAGHLIEPPYTPHCYASWHKVLGTKVVWGGDALPHAKAQEDAWKKILTFFKNRLNG